MPGTEAATPGILGDRMLTDAQVRKAKAATKPYRLTDGGGLHLYVTPAGGKLWRLRYEFERKEKLLSIWTLFCGRACRCARGGHGRQAALAGGQGSCGREAPPAPGGHHGRSNDVRGHRPR